MDADTLTIMDVTDRDRGTYTCVMNTTLDHDSASAVLTVVGKFTGQEPNKQEDFSCFLMSSITSLLQICATDLKTLFALPALSEATPTPAIVYGKQCP